MSHIVIHDDHDEVTHYARFDDIQEAARYLEELHTGDSAANARLYALEEVHFEVRSYVKIEIDGGPAAEPHEAVEASDSPPVFTDAPVDFAEPITDEIETVEYVEAAAAPVDAYSPPAERDDEHAGEPRRGLFGR